MVQTRNTAIPLDGVGICHKLGKEFSLPIPSSDLSGTGVEHQVHEGVSIRGQAEKIPGSSDRQVSSAQAHSVPDSPETAGHNGSSASSGTDGHAEHASSSKVARQYETGPQEGQI